VKGSLRGQTGKRKPARNVRGKGMALRKQWELSLTRVFRKSNGWEKQGWVEQGSR
jgi:hypothetical protein